MEGMGGSDDRNMVELLMHQRKQLEDAIKAKDAEKLDLLLETTLYFETHISFVNQPSLFDIACLHYFDMEVLQVLFMKKLAVIKDEELWKKALSHIMRNAANPEEPIENSASEASSTITSPHGIVLEEKDFKGILDLVNEKNLHSRLLKLVDVEKVSLCKGNRSLHWLYDYFRYGGWRFTNKVTRIMSLMDQELWEEALLIIEKEVGVSDVNDFVDIFFPESDAGFRLCLLCYAVIKDRQDLVKVILDKKADVNIFCTIKHSSKNMLVCAAPFELAAELNQANTIYICEELLNARANLYFQSYGPFGDVLRNVMKHGNLGLLSLILRSRRYCRPMLCDYLKDVQKYFPHADDSKVAEKLLKHSVRFGVKTKSSEIVVALDKGDYDYVFELLNNIKLDELNKTICDHELQQTEYTVLGYAIFYNHYQVLKILLDIMNLQHRSDLLAIPMYHTPCFKHFTPVEMAVKTENKDIIELLLSEIHFNPSKWLTAAICAVKPKALEIVLLNKPFDGGIILETWSGVFTANVGLTICLTGITNLLTIDLLNIICTRYFSVDRWANFIMNCFTCMAVNKRRECVYLHQILLTVILNYLPVPPLPLQTAWRRVKAKHRNQSEENTHAPPDSDIHLIQTIDMIFRNAPSLQRLSRYKISQCCRSLFAESQTMVGLPKPLEEYLKSPMESLQHIKPSEFNFSLHYI